MHDVDAHCEMQTNTPTCFWILEYFRVNQGVITFPIDAGWQWQRGGRRWAMRKHAPEAQTVKRSKTARRDGPWGALSSAGGAPGTRNSSTSQETGRLPTKNPLEYSTLFNSSAGYELNHGSEPRLQPETRLTKEIRITLVQPRRSPVMGNKTVDLPLLWWWFRRVTLRKGKYA